MQLSTERQETIKHLIATKTFRNLTSPAVIKLFCIDYLIMHYSSQIEPEMKGIFYCDCPFCDFFLCDVGDDCENCPWTEQFEGVEVACHEWLDRINSCWEDIDKLSDLRLPMLWQWREIYSKQLTI